MTPVRTFACAAALMTFAIAAPAVAACPGPPVSTLGDVYYDPFSPNVTVVGFSLTGMQVVDRAAPATLGLAKQRRGSESEGLAFDFVSTGFSMPNGVPVEFTAPGDVNVTAPWRTGGLFDYDEVRSTSVPANASYTGNFALRIQPGQTLGPGMHVIEYRTYNNTGDKACPGASGTGVTTRQFTINVVTTMALWVAGGASHTTMDFNDQLQTGARRTVEVNALANAPYRITMSTEFNSQLKLGGLSTTADAIPYTATLDGRPFSPSVRYVNPNPTGTGGIRNSVPLEVTIGNTDNVRAGFYRDLITLNIAPET